MSAPRLITQNDGERSTVEVVRQTCDELQIKVQQMTPLDALRDPDRRPPLPRDPLPEAIFEHEPEVRFSLEARRFAANLRSSRRGAAAGLSGMTTDHLRLVLDQVRDTHMLCQMADQFAQARSPSCPQVPSPRQTHRIAEATRRRPGDCGGGRSS